MDHGCVLVTYTLYDNTNQKSSLCEEVRHADPRISHVRRLGSGRAHICVPRRRHAPHLPAVVRHEHVVALQPVNATELGAEGRAAPGNAAQCRRHVAKLSPKRNAMSFCDWRSSSCSQCATAPDALARACTSVQNPARLVHPVAAAMTRCSSTLDTARGPLQSAACTYRIALGPPSGQKLSELANPPCTNSRHLSGVLCQHGFSLHTADKRYPSTYLWSWLIRMCRTSPSDQPTASLSSPVSLSQGSSCLITSRS